MTKVESFINLTETEEIKRDLLELADISTDQQLEDIKSGKIKPKKCKKAKRQRTLKQ